MDKTYRSGRRLIKAAVILRLLFNAALVINLAVSFADQTENLYRIETGNDGLPIVIAAMLTDTLLTALWAWDYMFHRIHRTVYILLGWMMYSYYLTVLLHPHGLGSLAVFVVVMPFLLLVGAIPFVMCSAGHRMTVKAQSENKADS